MTKEKFTSIAVATMHYYKPPRIPNAKINLVRFLKWIDKMSSEIDSYKEDLDNETVREVVQWAKYELAKCYQELSIS